MIQNILDDILGKKGDTPNRFTIEMGVLIRKARKEAGFSQSELAKRIYVRQASISDIENGKREVSSSEITYLSYTLNKPIIYFFPKNFVLEDTPGKIPPLLLELLLQARRLSRIDIKKIIIQTKALADLE